jgi:uncharacterized protein YcbK (DUF882 family)
MSIEAKFFTEKELACKCGCGVCNMAPSFVQRLDMARRIAGVPFHINSGYRCSRRNEAVGGVSDSSHTKGWAVDIGVSDGPSRFKIVRALIEAGFTRLGIGLSLIHVDSDPAKPPVSIWTYADK